MFRKCLAVAALALAATGAHAQAYPSKPIRLLIPFPPGGGTDILSRLIATRLGEAEKWTVVSENRAGAGGTIGIAAAVRAAPTGYEMVMGQKDNLVVAPWLYKSVTYDPTKDLVAVAHVGYTPIVIVTQANSPFKTLADVVAAAKAAPGSITYGSPGSGTTIHLAGEIFKEAAKIDIRHIPYKGSNAAMMDVLAGNVNLMVSSVPSAMAQIQSGKLRPLAVTSAKRSTSLPDVPTVAELGYKGFDVSTWYGLFMPAGTPGEIVATVNTAVNRLLAMPETREAIHAQGAEAQAMSTDEFARLLKADYQKWKDIVRAANVTVE
ncbi:tripartite tricarboxylate transporter substrate binding protein [Pigmentiphaga sp.]|uniref:Bug family tripartite tricarboxylate transporter substrate binding protein n=1 Tax=Pigmentiphaga sp. TaxID=1977564 RepID=UPI00128CF432|nr:tripartite tricarboxylate transporter substrate binding protein [Pigmentiphaga sp.]MPS27711.1 tripartite tricarboxylate transporter substrate binding protein [Alcaligenaceae bacterium SAGV5]MPS55131.1 tripartite tricarboxylate transporter substrate binding protein [Alcaligenaceae bacterium SAGV3]MPT58304.1 tripartite tricarboxylate transporter substrate binding protein [Alcaligenaceae bacterium]